MGGNKLIIGVLGLQGAVLEHVTQIKSVGEQAVVIKKPEQLKDIDGLVIPGGESTTMEKLMSQNGFLEPIRDFFEHRKPIFGTCAGMVLVAKHLDGAETHNLGLMDITVKRNGFGRQRESFEAPLFVKGMKEPFKGIFIRAPFALSVGEGVEILARYDENIVAAREGHVLVSAFHPELSPDFRFMQMFIDMVKNSIPA